MQALATNLVLALAMAAAVGQAGCAQAPEARLPGVFTHSEVVDDFRCGELLFAAGCVIVRVPAVDSGCVPEVPGYVVCNATVAWSVESGAVAPQSRLSVAVNGTPAGGTCMANPGATCRLDGTANFTHRFDGPGERHSWNVTVVARLDAPGDAAATTGEFTLTVRMLVRTEGRGATDIDT